MIIPSIDLEGGCAVQLIGGERKALDAGDPLPLAETFRLAGEIAVIDLDAARGRGVPGANREVIERLCAIAPCRVGGGIRDVETAVRWLDAGAVSVILGTAARPDILRELPRERVIAALDARDGEVVVEGWTKGTGAGIFERIAELRDLVGGFLITIVEREGRMSGVDLELAGCLRDACGDARLTFAGGVRAAEEIGALDALGVDAQVGMALYTGTFSLADAIAAPLRSDRADGLWPTVVVNERGEALGLAYSSRDSLRTAVETKSGVYFSRSRNEIWRKGATSGHAQELLRIDLDCDRDAIRFTVRQSGPGFCHLDRHSCWGEARGLTLLEQTIRDRGANPISGSYTDRLFNDAVLLRAKIEEESREFVEARSRDDVIREAADLIYFAMVRLRKEGITLDDVERELDRRALRLSRRPGDAKTARPRAEQRDERVIPRINLSDIPVRRGEAFDRETLAQSRRIVDDVFTRGLDALREQAICFGEIRENDSIIIGRDELERAAREIDTESRALLERTANRIRAFAEAQLGSIHNLDFPIDGGVASHRIIPVETAGCYAPGGRYPLPSSALMTAVTARAAGVKTVVVASPKPTPLLCAAAFIGGADLLVPIGGAHAIAALARGIEGAIPPCEVIAGPGNRWVTAAKHIVSDRVGIDMLAGPSELLIVADATADPAIIAADLLAQAEHDDDAVPMLIALTESLIARVEHEIVQQLESLPTFATARRALRNGFVAVAADLGAAVAASDRVAPEHLELLIEDAASNAGRFRNYGGLFIGAATAEVFGDYGAGPNHTLPTGGVARYAAGLSVFNFIKFPTQIRMADPTRCAAIVADSIALARLEGLEGHARSAERRWCDPPN